MDEPLLFVRQTHSCCDIARVDSYGSRMTGRIAITCIECCDERSRERQTRTLEASIGLLEASYSLPLLLVEMNQPLQGDCWNQEGTDDCHGVELISVDEQRDDGRVQRRVNEDQRT